MKNFFSTPLVFALLLIISPAPRAEGAQKQAGATPSTLKQVTLFFELQDLPGRDAAGSTWEVSYQWRIADQRDFNQWSANGEDPAAQASLGVLLSKQSFTHRNLSNPENRRFDVSIPVNGELLERLSNAGQRSQIAWLDATVRIRDAKLGTDVIKKVTPVWGPHFYLDGTAGVRMELTPDGKLRWSTAAVPPWAGGQQQGVKKSRVPSP